MGSSGTWLISFLAPRGSIKSVDRVVGMAATVGLGVVILKLFTHAMSLQRHLHFPRFLHPYLAMVMRTLRLENDQFTEPYNSNGENDQENIRHVGSCHCKSIQFELWARGRLSAIKYNGGKITFPRVQTVARQFQLIEGADMMKMYYLSNDDTMAAHAFCGRCGVHILRAPDSNSDRLEVNGDCLDDEKIQLRVKQSKEKEFTGMPVSSQWDDLSSANEEHRDWTIDSRESGSFLESAQQPLHQMDELSNGVRTHTPTALEETSKFAAFALPGTPTTMETNGSESHPLERTDQESLDSEPHSLRPKGAWANNISILPPVQRFEGQGEYQGESPSQGSTTTPMMRDQMKYYMSRHVKA